MGTGSEAEDLGDTTTDDEMMEQVSTGDPAQDLEDQVVAEMGLPGTEPPTTGLDKDKRGKTGGLVPKTPASKRTRLTAASAQAKATRKRRTERLAPVKKLQLPVDYSSSDTEAPEPPRRGGDSAQPDHGTGGPEAPAQTAPGTGRAQEQQGKRIVDSVVRNG